MDTHTRSQHARHSTGIRMLLRWCFFPLLCPPTGHDPRHLFVPAPTVRSLGIRSASMTFRMPRAVVVVSSVISLFFGLLSRKTAFHAKFTGSQLAGLACNHIPICTRTHTMHALRLSRREQAFYRPSGCPTLRRFHIRITHIPLDAGLTRTLHTRTRHLDTQTMILSRRPSSPHNTPDDIMAVLQFRCRFRCQFRCQFYCQFCCRNNTFAAVSMPRSRVSFTLVTYAPFPPVVPMRLYTLPLHLSLRSPMLPVSIHGCQRLLLPLPCR